MRCRMSGPTAQNSSRPDLQHADVRRERGRERPRRAPASDTSSATIRGSRDEGSCRCRIHVVPGGHAEPTAQVRRGRATASPSGSSRRHARSRRAPTGRSRSRYPPAPPTRRPAASRRRPSPERTPPTARIGVSGSAARHLEHRADRHRFQRGTREPTGHRVRASAAAPSRRRPSPGGESTSVSPCAPARTTPRASSTISGRGRRELREDGDRRHARHRSDDLRGAVRMRAEDRPLELLVRLRQPNLERRDLRPTLQHAREPHELLERAAGDGDDDRCPGTDVSDGAPPRRTPRCPGSGCPVVHVMPAGDSAILRRRVPPTRPQRDAPGHDGPDPSRVGQARELRPGPGATRDDDDGRRERQAVPGRRRSCVSPRPRAHHRETLGGRRQHGRRVRQPSIPQHARRVEHRDRRRTTAGGRSRCRPSAPRAPRT